MLKCLLPAVLAFATASAAGVGSVKVETLPLAVPERVNLQGYLADDQGNPVDGVKSMVFKIYRGGSLQWQEAQACTVRAGLFSTLLGQSVPIPGLIFEPGASCELDINVEGQSLSPRVELSSAPFAFRSLKSDSLTRPISGPEIADAAVTMGKLNQSGATSGQVIRWNGMAWAPATVAGGGVTSVSQGTGVTCTPNPITATGTVAVNTTYLDGRYIQNQTSTTQVGSFVIDGFGSAEQFSATSATTDVPAIWGSGETYCSGVLGDSRATLWAGAQGYNTHASGTGVVGVGNGEAGQVITEGSGGAFTGTANGVFGYAADPSTLPIVGGYFLAAGPPDNYSYVAMWDESGNGYRCFGNGECTQGQDTRDGKRMTYSVQATAPTREDRGRSQLVDGHARVDMDPLFLDCITATDAAPLDVFVQLNGDCRGVYVTVDGRGFDVRELQGGRSDTPFTWRALGAAKGHNGDRMERAAGPLKTRPGAVRPERGQVAR